MPARPPVNTSSGMLATSAVVYPIAYGSNESSYISGELAATDDPRLRVRRRRVGCCSVAAEIKRRLEIAGCLAR